MKNLILTGERCFADFSHDTDVEGPERPRVAIALANNGEMAEVTIDAAEAKRLHGWLGRWLKAKQPKRKAS